MARAKYQVLVLPFQKYEDKVLYCIFQRSDMEIWQFISGGGEDEDPSALVSAKREAFEEAHILAKEKYTVLETQCSIATEFFEKARIIWGESCLVIPEYSFAVEISNVNLQISHEHTKYEWVDYDTAIRKLRYDSNRVALWELDNKIRLGLV
ncbi:MAG: NUDIX domain-containing protein [Clostridium sp.]|uniref:NUDIX hydrolase n=1 Tax=Clostridium sp. TaxID=1506 RepID=UPI0030399264